MREKIIKKIEKAFFVFALHRRQKKMKKNFDRALSWQMDALQILIDEDKT
jgi:hypothetical protein